MCSARPFGSMMVRYLPGVIMSVSHESGSAQARPSKRVLNDSVAAGAAGTGAATRNPLLDFAMVERQRSSARGLPGQAMNAAPDQPRILVVDDEPDIAESFADLLRISFPNA